MSFLRQTVTILMYISIEAQEITNKNMQCNRIIRKERQDYDNEQENVV